MGYGEGGGGWDVGMGDREMVRGEVGGAGEGWEEGGGRREEEGGGERERKRKEEKERLWRGGGRWDLFKMVDRVGFCLNRSEYPTRTRVAPCNLSYERRNL